jgi:hypothetical protein
MRCNFSKNNTPNQATHYAPKTFMNAQNSSSQQDKNTLFETKLNLKSYNEDIEKKLEEKRSDFEVTVGH